MGIGIIEINHVQITVPASAEEASKSFYRNVLGLEEISKPGSSKGRRGAWFRQGSVEVHLSVEDTANQKSRRHICYRVADLSEAERRMRNAGIEIIADDRPIEGSKRFYVRDPGANRIEISQRLKSQR